MTLHKWSRKLGLEAKLRFTTCCALVAMLAACTPLTPKEDEAENTDSLRVVALTSRLDTVQGSLENATRELQEMKAQLDSLRDSIANVRLKNPTGDRVKYGGIPKGDPIKNSDEAKGRRLAPPRKPQPTQGTGKTPGKGVGDRPVTNQKLLDSLDRVAAQRNKYWDSLWVEKQKKLKEAGK